MISLPDQNTFEGELVQIYDLNKKQLVELMFFDDEIKFLKLLLSRFFKEKLADQQLNKMHMIDGKLSQINMLRINISKDVLTHQGNLDAQFKGTGQHNVYFYQLECDRIKLEMQDLEHQYRKVKNEIFKLSKDILSQRKAT